MQHVPLDALLDATFRDKREFLHAYFQIKPEAIIPDFDIEWQRLIEQNDVLQLGVNHLSRPEHSEIGRLIKTVNAPEDIVIAVEFPPRLQRPIDNFLKHGTFSPEEDPKELTIAISDLSNKGRTSVFISPEGTELYSIYDILKAAAQKEIEVIAIDQFYDESMEDYSKEREQAMADNISTLASKRKVLQVVGANHANKNGNDRQTNVRQILDNSESLGVQSLLFSNWRHAERVADRHQQTRPLLTQKLEPILKENNFAALKIDSNTFEEPGLDEAIGFDYFIPLT